MDVSVHIFKFNSPNSPKNNSLIGIVFFSHFASGNPSFDQFMVRFARNYVPKLDIGATIDD